MFVLLEYPALSSIPSGIHSGSGMDASDGADVVDWSCCRCVVVDIVEVVDHDVAMVEVVVVDVEFVVVDVATIAGAAKNCAMCMTELQSYSRRFAPGVVPSGATFCTLRGTATSFLRMLEDADIGETASFAKTGGSPPSTRRFCQDRVCGCTGFHKRDVGVSMQS